MRFLDYHSVRSRPRAPRRYIGALVSVAAIVLFGISVRTVLWWDHSRWADPNLARLHQVGHVSPKLIDLHRSTVTNCDLQHIATLRLAESLTLSGNPQLTDVGIAHCARLSNLRLLDLSQCTVGDDGLRHLQAMKRLEHLALRDCIGVTDAGLASLQALDKLSYLDLSGTSISNGGIAQLAALASLTHVVLRNTGVTDEGAATLRALAPRVKVQL